MEFVSLENLAELSAELALRRKMWKAPLQSSVFNNIISTLIHTLSIVVLAIFFIGEAGTGG